MSSSPPAVLALTTPPSTLPSTPPKPPPEPVAEVPPWFIILPTPHPVRAIVIARIVVNIDFLIIIIEGLIVNKICFDCKYNENY